MTHTDISDYTIYAEPYDYSTKRYVDPLAERIRTALDPVTDDTFALRNEVLPGVVEGNAYDGENLATRLDAIDEVINSTVDEMLIELHDVARQIETERDELWNELREAQERLGEFSPAVIATELLHELHGRILTDEPVDVLAWIDRALAGMVRGTGVDERDIETGKMDRHEPETVTELTTLLNTAIRVAT